MESTRYSVSEPNHFSILSIIFNLNLGKSMEQKKVNLGITESHPKIKGKVLWCKRNLKCLGL